MRLANNNLLRIKKSPVKASSRKFYLQIVYFLILAIPLYFSSYQAQNQDTSIDKIASKRNLKIIDATIDFYTTLNGNRSVNSLDQVYRNNLYFYYNFTVQNRIKIKKIKISNYFFNEYGLRRYKDSILDVSEDIYNFKNSVSLPLKKSHFDLHLSINSKSQFWKHYKYFVDSNNTYLKNLYSDYLSPGYVIYSGGLRYNFWNYSSIEIGLASGKTTKIKNQKIFGERKSEKLYGLEKGDYKKTILGLHLLVNISAKKLCRNFYMEQFSQVFIDKDSINKIRAFTFDINNVFHYFLLRYIRFSVRTKILYDQAVYIKPAMIQQFSIGFFLNNKL